MFLERVDHDHLDVTHTITCDPTQTWLQVELWQANISFGVITLNHLSAQESYLHIHFSRHDLRDNNLLDDIYSPMDVAYSTGLVTMLYPRPINTEQDNYQLLYKSIEIENINVVHQFSTIKCIVLLTSISCYRFDFNSNSHAHCDSWSDFNFNTQKDVFLTISLSSSEIIRYIMMIKWLNLYLHNIWIRNFSNDRNTIDSHLFFQFYLI